MEEAVSEPGAPITATGVAAAYRDVLEGIVADEEAEELPSLVTATLLDEPAERERVARDVLSFAETLRG